MQSGRASSGSSDGYVIPATPAPMPRINEKKSTVENKTLGTLPPRAVDGFRRKLLTRRRHQDGQFLELKHGWAVQLYEYTMGSDCGCKSSLEVSRSFLHDAVLRIGCKPNSPLSIRTLSRAPPAQQQPSECSQNNGWRIANSGSGSPSNQAWPAIGGPFSRTTAIRSSARYRCPM